MQRVAIVTGGSSGIGAAIAVALQAEGTRVYEFSRSGQQHAGIAHRTVDLLDEAQVRAGIESVVLEAGRLDLLVNNAGNGVSGAVEFLTGEQTQAQFALNFFGAMTATRAALPYLREARGMIINISSAAALFPIPFQTYYSASKAALTAATLALRGEVRPFGVRVAAVLPGDVQTGFTAARRQSHAGREVYGEAIDRSVAKMAKDEATGMPPAAVAKSVCRVARKRHPKPVTVAGTAYKLLALAQKLLPARWVQGMVCWMYSGR